MNLETSRLELIYCTGEQFKELMKLSPAEKVKRTGMESAEKVEIDFKHICFRFFEDNDGFEFWYARDKETGRFMGQLSLHCWVKRHYRAELGYMFHPDFHGKGYATEAASAVVDYGFKTLGLNRIEAFTAPSNPASQNVLIKLGFSEEGLLKSHYRTPEKFWDSIVFGLVREDYEKRKK